MVTNGMLSHNGAIPNGTSLSDRGTILNCPSDYEPRPVIDVVPTAPKPGWRDQYALFTDTVQWLTPDGISHSLTIRSDDLGDLMRDVKLIRAMILKSREQHAAPGSESEPGDGQEPMTKPCDLHGGAPMKRRVGKNGAAFYSHQVQGGNGWCNGRSKA